MIDVSSQAKTCQNLPNYPWAHNWAVGGLDNNFNPVVCGGMNNQQNAYASNLCYTYFSSTRTWVASPVLTEPRSRAAFTTVASPSNLGIFVAGGISSTGGTLCSVESLNSKSNQYKPEHPERDLNYGTLLIRIQ